MTRRFFLFILLLLILFAFGCQKPLAVDGVLWYGQSGRTAIFDLATRKILLPKLLEQCDEIAADALGENLVFVSANNQNRRLLSFSLGRDRLFETLVDRDDTVCDPSNSLDGSRSLFRVRRAGDIADLYLHFKGSNYALLFKRIGAACFGQDNRTVYLGEGNRVAVHMMDDLTRPDTLPPGGLHPFIKTEGSVRDLDFHVGTRKLVVCAGTKTVIYDQTGNVLATVFDATNSDLPGALAVPYRARWSPDGSRLAILVSSDGKTGRFRIVDPDSGKHLDVLGPTPKVGGFDWTQARPATMR
jgi:hypothetical protein